MKAAERFLALPLERRTLAFEQAAAGVAGQAVILEKDFWVSWLLGLLFTQPELAPFLVFKGGTSLSKVFGVIDRFSEDIDLCLVPDVSREVKLELGTLTDQQPTGRYPIKPRICQGLGALRFGSTRQFPAGAAVGSANRTGARLRHDASHVHDDTAKLRGLDDRAG